MKPTAVLLPLALLASVVGVGLAAGARWPLSTAALAVAVLLLAAAWLQR